MITKITVATASSIFVSDDVFNLKGARESEALSVAKFSTIGSLSKSVASVLNFIYDLIGLKFPEHDLLIFLGSST